MKRFLSGFVFAWNGLRVAFSEQGNLRFHVAASIVAVAAGFYFNVTQGEWLAITLTIAFVLAAELINTAIESLVNLISPERNPLAGKVKDIAAAAVLVSAAAAVVIAVIIFSKYIIN